MYLGFIKPGLVLLAIALYVVIVGQIWAYYAASLMIAAYDLNGGRLGMVPT